MGSLQNMAGPLLIGYLLNLCLLGILAVQVFIYSVAFNSPNSRENNRLKILVYVVLLLEVIQSAFILRDAFVTFAQQYGNPNGFDNVQFTWLTMPVLSGIVGCIVQSFYAFRVYSLSRKLYVLPIFIVLLALTQCVAAIAVGIDENNARVLSVLSRAGVIGNYVWPVVSAVCDVTIVFAMSFYLMKAGKILSDPQFGTVSSRPTRTILGRALHLTVETGALTATFSILYLALWVSRPGDFYYMTFAFIMGKIYANSLMVILNSRVSISDLRDEPRFIDSFDSIQFRNGLSCKVERMVEIASDKGSTPRPSLEKIPAITIPTETV